MKSTDDHSLFPTPIGAQATGGTLATIPATQTDPGDGTASLAQGFPPETFIDRAAGGRPPRGADMNGFLWLLSHAVQALQAGYVGPFNATFAQSIGGYPSGAIVAGSSVGTFWVSTADNNTTTPGANGAAWKSFFDGLATQAWANGLFATIAALNAETLRATTVESNLQSNVNNRVSKTGDLMTGGLTIDAAYGLNVVYDPGGQVVGQYVNYAGITSTAGGRGGSFGYWVQELVGSTFIGVIALGLSDGSFRYVRVQGKNARLNDSSFGDIAYVSDLAGYQPKGAYAQASDVDSGTITGGWYTRIKTVLRQSFIVQIPGNRPNNTYVINYPITFKEGTVPVLELTGTDSGQSRTISLAGGGFVNETGFSVATSLHGNSTGGDSSAMSVHVTATGTAA